MWNTMGACLIYSSNGVDCPLHKPIAGGAWAHTALRCIGQMRLGCWLLRQFCGIASFWLFSSHSFENMTVTILKVFFAYKLASPGDC